MLWVEGPLSYLEQLCMVSFRDAGHPVRLYTYGAVSRVPEGIEVRPAAEILPREGFLTHARTGSSALHSDLFRYHMLVAEPGIVWADTDIYCIRPLQSPSGHLHGFEGPGKLNGAVLALPGDSATLRALLDFTADEFAIPPFYPPAYRRELREAAAAGTPVHVGAMPWGVWGPHALTHFLKATGEVRESSPEHVFYPFSFRERRRMLLPDYDTTAHIRPDTLTIHFYGRRMRKRLVEAEGGVPPPASLIGRLLARHGIDPEAAPIPRGAVLAEPAEADDDEARDIDGTEVAPVAHHIIRLGGASDAVAQVPAPPAAATPAAPLRAASLPEAGPHLTELADRHGSDKGSTKHRYTELYHMLFLPLRDRPIRLLEMGLQIGGPEHGRRAGRQTTDLPSVRMWLEYFPHAEIVGLDVSDFGWFHDPRFRFIRCDMDKRAEIARAAAAEGPFDIIIDDASHASHHQQFALLEWWPKLRPGGLYIIEDLAWQPESYEREGFTKTADVLQSYLASKSFSHSDPAIGAELDALSPSLSGVFVHQARFLKRRRDQIAVLHKR
ncbi:MAG: class I SAM-dependent methyltransferase [Gemmobacter sp.]